MNLCLLPKLGFKATLPFLQIDAVTLYLVHMPCLVFQFCCFAFNLYRLVPILFMRGNNVLGLSHYTMDCTFFYNCCACGDGDARKQTGSRICCDGYSRAY